MAFVNARMVIRKGAVVEMTVEEFEAWLRRFDSNGDGFLSPEELRRAIRSLGLGAVWRKVRQEMAEEISKLVVYAQQHLALNRSAARA